MVGSITHDIREYFEEAFQPLYTKSFDEFAEIMREGAKLIGCWIHIYRQILPDKFAFFVKSIVELYETLDLRLKCKNNDFLISCSQPV